MRLPGNMQAMMKQAREMQERLQQDIAQVRVEASAGGGMVTVQMDGQKNLLAVKIDPEVVRSEDLEMLQDLVMAAANDALRKARELLAQEVSRLAGGLGLPPGLV